MYQKVIIIGNLGADPELRYLPNGTAVTNFSVATSRRWTDANGQQCDETTWFKVSVWGKYAEKYNQSLHKGAKVMVEGRLVPDGQTGSPRTFTRRDGTAGASFDLSADTIRMLSGKESQGNGEHGTAEAYHDAVTQEDEIPF